MIVREEPDGSLVLINQTDHAKISGVFAAHWGNGEFARPRPYEPAVRAAIYHDNGWKRYETGPRCDPTTGKVPNFLQVFDVDDGRAPCPLRTQTVTAPQGLFMMNGEEIDAWIFCG